MRAFAWQAFSQFRTRAKTEDRRSQGAAAAIEGYRKAIGRVVLIGLEILVAATIIKTITLDPTFENMGLLAIMITIRTALGWSMALEMNGSWPWQKRA